MNDSALSNRSFLTYLIGSTVSLHGVWVYRVALGWFTWDLTASELWVGIVAFTQFAPAVVFGPLFGVLVDRFDRRKASILINALSAINISVLGVLTWFGFVDIVVLATQSLVQGALDGANTPIRMTLVPSLVKKEQLHSAIASSSISFNVSRFIGPAIAGFIIVTFGVSVAFLLTGVSYLSVITAVLLVRVRPVAERSQQASHVLHQLVAGVRYVVAHRTIRDLLMSVAVASVFGRGALEMMPAFADAVFERGSSGLATLTAAIGIGAIVSGLLLSRNTSWLTGKVVRLAVAGAGVLVAIFGANSEFWIAVPLVAVMGLILSLCGVGSQILIQTLVEENVRGRVSSLWGMIAFGGTALGSLLVGSTADVFGLQGTVIVTGLLCAAIALLAPAEPASD